MPVLSFCSAKIGVIGGCLKCQIGETPLNKKPGIIFNIQKFCIKDGPGIRTTVFLKGCPLKCAWCHNPESQSMDTEIFYDAEKCTSCKKCIVLCENGCHKFENSIHTFNRENCTKCGKCVGYFCNALETIGYQATVDDVIDEVMKDKIFYDNSGGGITLSGGEPMQQFKFAYELLKRAKEKGLHTCMETCGYANSENYNEIAKYVDIFNFDYKETNPVLHKKYTGVSNELIIKNLHILDDLGAKISLGCPIIPTLNDRDDHFEGIAKTANSLKNVLEINVVPYHPLAVRKYANLGKTYELSQLTFPSDDLITEWISKIQANTKVIVRKK